MKKTTICAAAAFCLVAAVSATRPRAEADPSTAWNRKAAAAYLDQRATWWTTWPNAQRDHQTFCVSCHTALPYALARPALRQPLGETGASAAETALLANITKRVTMWRDVEPFYPDQTRGVPKTSAWTWLQFHNEPWEGDSSAFHGAALAAIGIHSAPGGYAAAPENVDRVKALHAY